MVNETIGKYKIIEKIAEGGIGEIFKAIDLDNEEIVAVKTLRENINRSEETLLRFKKEAEILSNLEHPNILRLLDFIEKDGNYYIVTEYLEGKNLKQLIKNNELSIDEKIQIILQIAIALDYVHSLEIIHKDIKPSNIIILDNNMIKILDFGIANLTDFQKLFSSKKSVEGSFAYMPPEQSGMLKRKVDNRSDLYSLGILFYQLITGELPFKAKEIGELFHQHIAKNPEKPINLIDDLSPIINKIILKLLRKDPDDRYQTAFGLAEDLEIYLSLNDEQKQTFYLELGKKDRLKNLNYSTALISRQNELHLLLESLNDTILGKGSISAILGKSGTGKTRLINELNKYTVTKNILFFKTSSTKNGQNFPYYPLIEIMKRILEIFNKYPEKQQQELYEKIRNDLGDEGKLISKIFPEIEAILGDCSKYIKEDIKSNTEVFFSKIKDFFVSVSTRSNPIVIAFDDADYWDHGTTQFFDYLKKYIHEAGILILIAINEENIYNVKDLHEIIKTEVRENKMHLISLSSFTTDDIKELINEIFGNLILGVNELANRLLETTEGNPLLIIENIKTLVDEDVITIKDEKWQVNIEKLSSFRLSSTIQEKILTRLSKINSRTKTVLTFAAIFGIEFNFQMLHEAIVKFLPDFTSEELLTDLREAINSQLVYETISNKGDIVYTFVFDKIVDSLLAKLSESDFRKMHETTANVIEKLYDDNDKAYKLAYHYLNANKRNKAYQYSHKAGEDALKSFSYKLAIKFFSQALDILRKHSKDTASAHKTRIQLSLEIVEIQHQTGEYKENIELLDEIIPIAREIDDKEDLARIYFLKGRNLAFMGEQHKAMECYKEAQPLAEESNLEDILAIVYCSIGRTHAYTADYDNAIELLSNGIDYFDDKDKLNIERLYPLGMLCQSLGHTGQKELAYKYLEELKNFLDIDDEGIAMWTNFYIGSTFSLLGDVEEAFKHLDIAYEICKKLKNPAIELSCLLFNGKNYAYSGDYKTAITNISKSIEIALEHNFYVSIFVFYFYLAEYYIVIGNYAYAKECITEGMKEKFTLGVNPKYVDEWHKRMLAFIELVAPLPDIENALKNIDDAIKTTQELGNTFKLHQAHNYMVKAFLLKRNNNPLKEEESFKQAIDIYTKLGLDNDVKRANKLREIFSIQKILSDEYDEDQTSSYLGGTSSQTGSATDFYYQRQLKYLLKLSEKLAQVHEMESLLTTIIQLSIEVSGAENGFLLLFDNGAAADNLDALKVKVKKSVNITEEDKLDYHKETVKLSALNRKGKLILDAEKEFSNDSEIEKYHLKSIIVVPLLISGTILGVIYLDNRQVKGLFTKENFELLKAFAIEAAISIENARLYEKVKESARIEEEMRIAEDIQTSILPNIKEISGYQIATFMRTATEVGGDYYDFYLKDLPYFGVFGDVAGHGLKSGLVMMMSEVSFNTLMNDKDMRNKKIKELYHIINSTLYENIQNRIVKKSNSGNEYANLYMTFRIFRFDDNGNFEMYGNDHAEPFILNHKNDEIKTIPSKGMLIGLFDDMAEEESEKFKLNENDIFVLYSDGISEARSNGDGNSSREMFTEKRIYQVIKDNKNKDVKDIVKAVIESVDDFMAEQDDDITLAIIKKV